jgi:hypothetical protein
MRITSSGNLLVGTTTDNGEKLQVNGEITAVTRIRINKSTQSNQIFGDGNAFSIGGSNNLGIRNDSGSIVFASGGANVQMLLNTSGNVGIGTDSPQRRLDVFTFASSATEYQLSLRNGAGANNVSTGIAFGFNSQSFDPDYLSAISSIITNRTTRAADLTFLTAATGTLVERMRITSGGNVGVGTNSPSYLFTVGQAGTTQDSVIQIASTTTGTGSLYFGDTTGTFFSSYMGGFQYSHFNNLMVFITNATEQMRILSSGNVLIGTTTDVSGAKLNVNGAIRTGTLDTGYVPGNWKLGRAVIGTQPSETHQIIVEINGALFVIGAAQL